MLVNFCICAKFLLEVAKKKESEVINVIYLFKIKEEIKRKLLFF